MSETNKKTKHTVFLGIRVSAIIEIVVFLFIITFCSYLFGNNDRFINITPHPFWIILILVVVQYNLPETILCIVLMILFLYTGNIPPQNFTETTFDYYFSLSLRPILWLAVAALTNGIRKRRLKNTIEYEEKIEDLNTKLNKISEAFNILQKKNENLETKLAGELNSAITIYNAVKKLKYIDENNYMQIMEEVILAILPTKKFSIYTYDNFKGLNLKYTYCWEQEDDYKTFFDNESEIYKAIVAEQRVLFVVRAKDEAILMNEGIMAGPLIDLNSGEILGMLKYEDIDFSDFVSKKLELFKLLCQWLGSAYHNLITVSAAKSNSMINRDNMLYSNDFLTHQITFLTNLAKRSDFPLTSILIKIANSNELNYDIRKKAVLFLGNTVESYLRATDQAFDKDYRNGVYLLIMPGTNKQGAETVLQKLRNTLLNPKNKELKIIKYAFQIEVLNI